MPRIRSVLATALACTLLHAVALADVSRFPFPEGSVLSRADAEGLREWLPAPFWAHRRHFFFEGMRLEIGPTQRDYSPAPVYQEATQRYRGRARIAEDGTLEGHRAGQPFPVEAIDCANDAEAGTKLIWDFVHRWEGFGARASFRYTYWDRGQQLPLLYEGTTSAWLLKFRPEHRFDAHDGDVFRGERRFLVVGFEVEKPPDMAGTRSLTYRYADSFAPRDRAVPEDTYVYLRSIRRVRKISEVQRSSAVSGTDFTFDDLFSFSGLPSHYHWKCLERRQILAPMNTRVVGYPYSQDGRFGASGLSYASDRWELRAAVRLEMVPKDPDHPYSRKEIWLDEQTLEPLYSFAYDRTGALWKIIYHNHRWSEDALGEIPARDWYPGWEEVSEPRDLRIISEAILNVQTGTGNRLDFWDSHGTPPDLKTLRRYIDIRRLRRGR